MVQGHEEGEYTLIGEKWNMVIDYVIGDIEVRDRIKRMIMGNRVDSDPHPVEVRLEGEMNWKRKRDKSRKR